MGIIQKIRNKKIEKQKAEEAKINKQKELEEIGAGLYEAYTHRIMATRNNIGTYEENIIDDRNSTHTAYSPFGPIEMQRVYEKINASETASSIKNYTSYEGYIAPSATEAKSGYFNFKVSRIVLSNPVERETHVLVDYKGIHRDCLGKVYEIKERMKVEDTSIYAGEYGAIAKKFDSMIQEAKAKKEAADETSSELE